MLPANRQAVLARIPDDALVLDVGGWASPLARADWVLDLQPYATRGDYGYLGDPAAERFTAETWVQRDICDREPWPFEDGRFDFAICSHTLEDVRDPVFVCQELSRVAKAGYVEVPSRLMEQAFGIQGPWVGYGHHHWLVERVGDADLEFVFKSHVLNGQPLFQLPAAEYWAAPEEARVHAVFWEGEIRGRERIFIGHEEHDSYVANIPR